MIKLLLYTLTILSFISCSKELTVIEKTPCGFNLNSSLFTQEYLAPYNTYTNEDGQFSCNSDMHYLTVTQDSSFFFTTHYAVITNPDVSLIFGFDTVIERKDLEYIYNHNKERRQYFVENYQAMEELFVRDSFALTNPNHLMGMRIELVDIKNNKKRYYTTAKTLSKKEAYFKVLDFERSINPNQRSFTDAIKLFTEFRATLYANDGDSVVIDKSTAHFFFVP